MIERISIKDHINDVSVKYLFVKHWSWTDPLDKEKYQGAPVQGRVYRAVYNSKTNSYRFIITENPMNGLLMPDLNSSNEMNGYTSEIVALTKNNLLDQNIKEEDLDKLTRWMEDQNKDIFTTQPQLPENFPMIILESLNSAEHQREMEEANRMAYAMEALSDLDSVNSIQFEIIIELIEYLYQQNLLNHEGDDIALDAKLGIGVNISRTLDTLKRYAGKNRRTNEDPEDLLNAISHLVTERERRIINDLDEE